MLSRVHGHFYLQAPQFSLCFWRISRLDVSSFFACTMSRVQLHDKWYKFTNLLTPSLLDEIVANLHIIQRNLPPHGTQWFIFLWKVEKSRSYFKSSCFFLGWMSACYMSIIWNTSRSLDYRTMPVSSLCGCSIFLTFICMLHCTYQREPVSKIIPWLTAGSRI